MSTQSEKKAGRPVGSVENPRTLLKRDMLATSKLNRTMRELAEKLVKKVNAMADRHDISLEDQLKIISTLTGSLQNQSRSMESLAKVLAAADAADDDLSDNKDRSAEDVLNELTRGKV